MNEERSALSMMAEFLYRPGSTTVAHEVRGGSDGAVLCIGAREHREVPQQRPASNDERF